MDRESRFQPDVEINDPQLALPNGVDVDFVRGLAARDARWLAAQKLAALDQSLDLALSTAKTYALLVTLNDGEDLPAAEISAHVLAGKAMALLGWATVIDETAGDLAVGAAYVERGWDIARFIQSFADGGSAETPGETDIPSS